MTNQEALSEAIKRWGNSATVLFVEKPKWKHGARFSVFADHFTCIGSSLISWEDAFSDADRRATA